MSASDAQAAGEARPGPLGALLLLVALALPWLAGDAGAPPRDPLTGAPTVTDGPSAWRLRRIALALTTTRLEQVDSFLSFPSTVDVVDLPVYDELVAVAARALTAGRAGAPGRPLDAALLERVAAGVGPLLGALSLLALHALLRQGLAVARGPAFGACLAVGLSPLWLAAARPGVLRIELFATLVLLLGLRALLAALRARAPVDRFTHAMIAGAAFGLGLATTPLFALPVVAAWAAFLPEAARAADAERDDLGRTFLLFWITAALGGLLPSLGGPWLPADDGLVRGWTRLVSELALCGALPFALLRFAPAASRRALGAWGGLAAPGVGLAVAVGLLLAAGPDHPRTALFFAALDVDASGPDGWAGAPPLAALGLALWLLLAAGLWWAPLAAAPRAFLVTLVALTGLAGALHPPAALLGAPAVAVGAAGWLAAAGGRRVGVGLLAAGLALGALSLARVRAAGHLAGLEVVRVCRELREAAAPAGPWNSVRAVQPAGVLADPEAAPLVVWHARRPCASLGPARNGDLAGRHALLEVLSAEGPGGLVRGARRLRLAHVLTGAGSGVLGGALAALAGSAEPGRYGVRRLAGGGPDGPLLLALEPPP